MDEGDDTTIGDTVAGAVASGDTAPVEPLDRRTAEVSGPRASVILGASVAVLALAVAGVIAWRAWTRDDPPGETASAPTAAPDTVPEGEGGNDNFVFVRTTDEGIQVRAQRSDFGAMGGGGVGVDDVRVGQVTVPAITASDVVDPPNPPPPTVASPDGLVRPAPTTTLMMAPDPPPTDRPRPGADEPAVPDDSDGNGRPDICDVVGDLAGWAITDDAILQGSSPITEGVIPQLYPSLLWPGEQPTVFAVVVQVDDSVTSVRLTGPNGGVDEMEPVEGAVVVALRSDVRFDGDPAALRPFALTAGRADGSTLRADWAVMQRGHPAWGGDPMCNQGIVEAPIQTIPPPQLQLPAPGAEQPADPAVARTQIETTFSGLYGAPQEGVDRLGVIDDPYGMAETMEQVRENGFGDEADSALVEIDELVFVSATDATFSYTLTTSGIDFGEQLGRARLLDGIWKITRATLCQDLAKAGAACPP